jgi:hypothetical protein
MNELVKIALLGVGGYIALKYLTNTTAAPVTMPIAPAPPTTTQIVAAAMAPAGGAPNPVQAAIDQAYAASLGDALLFNPDEWNFWRQQSTGIATTTDLVDPANRALKVNALAYHQLRAAKGLSGIRKSSWGI